MRTSISAGALHYLAPLNRIRPYSSHLSLCYAKSLFYREEKPMKNLLIVACILMLTGCARSASPVLYNGKYYMAGDESCALIRELSDSSVMCMDENQNDTGYRNAMTAFELQMYAQNQQIQLQQMQQLGQQLEQTGQSFQNSGQQMLQAIPQIQTDAPYYDSSSGTTYRRVGNVILGSDGTRCQIVGQNMLCN